MPAAHWLAVVYYGDNSFDIERKREQQFSPDEDGHIAARDWIELCLEDNWKFMVAGVEYILPYNVINHCRIFFVEETPEEP